MQYKFTKLTPGDVLGEWHKTRCEEGTKCPIIATLHIVQPHHMQRVNVRERERELKGKEQRKRGRTERSKRTKESEVVSKRER